jgi:sRNA-binding carbon storage regulator CsrA
MLVLNRRPGESIVIEHGIQLTVLSVTDRKVWLGLEAPGIDPAVRVSATAVSDEVARLEIGAPTAVSMEGEAIRVEVGGEGHPAIAAQATFSVNRTVGQSLAVGEDLRIGVGSVAKGNPCITLESPTIGSGLRITLIRPAGSYVRIGVEAPDRRVYRKELWDDMVAANKAAAGEGDDLSSLLAGEPAPGGPPDASNAPGPAGGATTAGAAAGASKGGRTAS